MKKNRWLQWPLKRMFFAVTTAVLVFLTLVILLGIRQYLLYDQCQQAVTDADRLLFQFTGIKDHLNESLVLEKEINLQTLSGELLHLEKETEQLKNNILVPETLKSTLPTRVDLVGIEVRLRAIHEKGHERAKGVAEIIRILNSTNITLQQFRFLLTDHTQSVLVGLHRIIIGTLGLIVVLSCTLLYLLNRYIAAPILSLSELPALKRDDKDTDGAYSMSALLMRVRHLLQNSIPPYQQTTDSEITDAARIRQETLRYRYAVTGYIGPELASELTNSLNGIVNYTQTLIDICEHGINRDHEISLCRGLMKEEKKTVELVAALQKISQWQAARSGSDISLSVLFDVVGLLLEKPLHIESITLTLPTNCQHTVTVPAGDLWLTLLTLLHQGKMALTRETTDPEAEKWIRIRCRPHPDEGNRLQLILTNSMSSWHEDPADSVWPSSNHCAHLLQLHGAALIEEGSPGKKDITLELPCRTISP
ncbi:MAG: hypothetical protein GXY53_07060 [Desulfobulbus sp.]|nr:hypothetical protein [Desulfobulbus sp.]